MTPIQIRGLRKQFGTTAAVDGIDLDIPGGHLFFLLGPSGCGKTTLLRMLAGFTDPTAGRIAFGDRDVTHLPPHQRNTGMVFQGYALWPHMTVRQNVAFGLEVRKLARAEVSRRVDEALGAVQLTVQADRRINQLSGGQQQRVALARALVIKPTVLLLDEPLSNLDAKLRTEMRQSIRDICKASGITGVYVTHDQKEALSMADQIAVLSAGRVMQVGPPRALYHRPAHRFVADFLGETNFLSARVKGFEPDPNPGLPPHVVLETLAGLLRSAAYPPDLPAGGNVTCSIRPEALRFVAGGGGDASGVSLDQPADGRVNTFPATRRQTVYLGEMAQHELMLPGGVSVKAYELNPQPLEPSEAGEPGEPGGAGLRVRVAPGDVVVLED